MSAASDYFEKRVPEAWNLRLRQQEECGAAGAERLAKMRAAKFALEIEVDGVGAYHLDVRGGEMRPLPAPDAAPLLTLRLSAADCQWLEQFVGPSPMKLLGGVGGNADFVLTPSRIEELRTIEGTMWIEVTGSPAWGVVMHFGGPPVPAPTTTISIGPEEFQTLIDGGLDLQGAFMTGKLKLDGNVEVPMKMAMAIMTPE